MQTENLIQTLIEQTRQLINCAENLKNSERSVLIYRAQSDSWNILECVEHLNLYSNYYIPEIEKSIKNSNGSSVAEFKSGILGSYFTRSMQPKEKLNKMKTFKDKNPIHAILDKTVIDKFIHDQLKLIQLLSHSRNVNLNRVRIKTSISGLIKLNLGDTLQFFVAHNRRHFVQIERIEKQAMNI